MSKRKFKPVKSRVEGFRQAIKVWVCTECENWHIVPPRTIKFCKKCESKHLPRVKQCPCGSKQFKSDKPEKCEDCNLNSFFYFASKQEADRWGRYREQEKLGLIFNLKTSVRIPLKVKGEDCGTYVADFMFTNADKKLVVVDSKFGKEGETKLYELKRKLVYAIYKIKVHSVYGERS